MEWSTACPDWAERLRRGESIIPPPIFPDQAEYALGVFKSLRVVDLPGKPTFGECSEQWVFDFVAAIFGAYDAATGDQLIREFFLLISKKNTKSTIAAGIMLTAVILCWREDEEHLILAPTKEVADNSFKPAAGMVRADDELMDLFHVQDHLRTIKHRVTNASLKVVAADTETVSGKKSGRILIDEHWLFGTKPNAASMFQEATGGQVSRNEGFVIYLSTQSDKSPAGVFKDKLAYYRDVRDGVIVDRKSLGVLYEFPPEMVKAKAYLRPENFYFTNPNIGKSVSAVWLEDELRKVLPNTDGSLQTFVAKHLNVEIGLGLHQDRWPGADFWEAAAAPHRVDRAYLLAECDVVVAGIDGGGLDDLLGLALLGRRRSDRFWVLWGRAWAHRIVLERRKDIATRLEDFRKQGDLVIVERPGDDVDELADILEQFRDAGLLPKEKAIGVDPAGIGDIVDELTSPGRGFSMDEIIGISQGWKLAGAIKTTERKVAGGEFVHGGQELMTWCVGNAKVVASGNATLITKAVSGTGKIDPLMAAFNATSLMALNPDARGSSVYETRGIRYL
jgi:phage terminase large subunit-like protein